MSYIESIRNFSIIAHIDHGKSTLADRLIEFTGALSQREMMEQVLDSLDIERERGITIKSQSARLNYTASDGKPYILNLIDTPGHVDFTYEVSRSLAACEGALLIIDATQGVEAQTIANLYLALEHDLEIIPVINKIDLPSADVDRVKEQIADLGLDPDEVVLCSAKEGIGIKDLLEAIVFHVPPPKGDPEKPLQALIFDSVYDTYRGTVVYFRIFEGTLRTRDKIRFMASGKNYDVTELGVLLPHRKPVEELKAGETGFLSAEIKDVQHARVGDTVTHSEKPAKEPLAGYRPAIPMVFCGLYPVDSDDYEELKEALGKLQLNDAALGFEPETSNALGFGFRCGFLGLLHMEIIQERLEREYDLALIATAPSVVYEVTTTQGEVLMIDNPQKMPLPQHTESMKEPYVKVTIIAPKDYVGPMMDLAQSRRGLFISMDYPTPDRVVMIYEMPLNEMMADFFDQLKSRSSGYASLDYEMIGVREADLVKLDILLNGEIVDALSVIVPREKAPMMGRLLTAKLREIIPRQMFEIPIQAAIGSRVVSRETVKAMRKNVLAKCYGGDISRKRKLLEKQKAGKKRMKQVGRVEIPQDAFMAVLRIGQE
ncbi:elongation factor 4 [bacterium (Candidatus Blackallbacteria) CG17_big_fil_post_rev_8_21_14_2_50_48_46]|uniref:Elongation factor 4 n=1 Tax=bacterium (Candidatus Blackallbacteria) CG17_big_fil_post_rev_8_21_14_2_50_48_46 TaxID=2014261 RepID=A0A2M7FXU8_9BACT|nr:MAG: elongation factor 4 [bacterium (Candidatus Blackallbacteria) CG18_big_fil_WC_8_21_14_2_50_49_26]PIW14097.1 MAG: elongation factor 4 [bacterium (Candidatus Blackallbacteria) CG17_big_fil_post_rev_8_21_14_2_50_48_46]PIW45827.1 MAG: elongation factor 4 [bacterium (Candidatus Blackallbacteria) CG13_big_fil_rev_8_21_14_2_50_49_14]